MIKLILEELLKIKTVEDVENKEQDNLHFSSIMNYIFSVIFTVVVLFKGEPDLSDSLFDILIWLIKL